MQFADIIGVAVGNFAQEPLVSLQNNIVFISVLNFSLVPALHRQSCD